MAGLPCLVRPMLATLRHRLPADQDRYGWEFKWDGVRTIAYVSGHQVRLLSRNNKDMTAILNRINSAAKQAGMATVIEEMRPGGKYADLRKQFNVALDENTHIRNDYENATNNLNAYADQRAEIREILKVRPQARKDFEEIDQDIAKGFFGLPGKEAGKSVLDEAAGKVKEVLESAVNAVRDAFGRKADQNATTRFALGP